ncbi:hypothetical protein KPH14_002574 [Odynerus spinipes]|uniref:Large ribosomal subunit protein uL14m n=1 Tax=Odynerus spinipes TaxID=1348599 RepID=A0AAD9R8Q2_9HYME|nr:hypothetical protein KPH14_002574 [Odynerus spinipes]
MAISRIVKDTFYFTYIRRCLYIIIMLSHVSTLNIISRGISTSAASNQIIKLARLRVVDNSDIGKQAMMEGKPPRCIHIYNKVGVGYIGDKVLVAIKGEKKKGILVGLKQKQKTRVPKFDSNNVVLIDDSGTPLGTRIQVPIPHILRTILKEKTHSKGVDYTKLLAIASRFV